VSEPKISHALLAALAAALAFLIADGIAFPAKWLWLKTWLVVAGFLLASLAAALAVVWLAWQGADLVERLRLGWASPELARLATISRLTTEQMTFARVDVQGIFTPGDEGKIDWSFSTRWGPIDGQWLVNYLETEGFAQYPWLSPIRLFSEGSVERQYRETFCKWMVAWGLLEKRPGERFYWLVDHAELLRRLGI